ncbi:MAG: hypothetical protein AB7I50_24120, partial [Vicinamibacterales bacterium]
ITCGCDLDGDGVNDRPTGSPRVVGRGDLEAQLQSINALRQSRNLAPFTLDRIKVPAPTKNIDVRLTTALALPNGQRMELFAEAFNVTNFVNMNGFSNNVLLPTFNIATGAQDARQVQWGARYSF